MSILNRGTVTWECGACHRLNHPECNFCEFCGAHKDNTPAALKLWGKIVEKAKPLAEKTASALGTAAEKARSGIANMAQKANNSSVEQIICPNCGSASSAGLAFCARCGASMKQQPSQHQYTSAPQTQQQIYTPPQPMPQQQTMPTAPVQPFPQQRPVPTPPVQPVPQQQPQGQTKLCSACGTANPSNEFFCRNCGSLL